MRFLKFYTYNQVWILAEANETVACVRIFSEMP